MDRSPARIAPLFALAILPTAFAARADAPQAPYTVVESGRTYASLQAAVDAIGGGQGTIRFASLRFADCAVQSRGDIAYVAAVPGRATLDGVACEGKAALVLRGRSARIEGLTFANIRVADKNGAGIRLEAGDLAVSQSWFRDSEQGILSGNDPAATISVDKSTFTRLGSCEGPGCAHSIYIGDYDALSVTRSRFEQGTGGHYLKSRAARIAVSECAFDDAAAHGTNYMIDLPDGATGSIVDNAFVQGADKENYSAFIAVAAEHRNHPSTGLTITRNNARFSAAIDRHSAFVADWSGEVAEPDGNLLGPGIVRYERR